MSMQQSLALRSSRVRRGDACTTCRRRKIKCDSGRPACNRCISSGSSLKCHYEIAPARSTTQWLQQRLEDLEESLALLESSTPVQSSKGRIPNIFSMPSRPHPYPIRTPGVVNLNSSSNATSLEVPMPLGDPLGEWWMDGELPVPVRDRLIRIFVSNRWQFSFEFSVSRLEASLRTLPPDHSDIHPAFLNAILLNACLYSRDSLRRLEPVFLARTRRALADSLGLATGLFDFLRASALLGMYYYWAGRNIEGHHYLSGTMRFALACGLHEITSLETATTGSLLSPARDLVEVGERINLFWMLYANDRAGSMLNRLPVAMPDKIIKTMYPYPLVYYETRVVKNGPLQPPIVLRADEQALEENHCTLRAKGFRYLSMAYGLAARVTSAGFTDAVLQDITKAANELSEFARTLPPFPERAVPPECLDDTVFPVIASTLVLVHTAVIVLHSVIADVDVMSRHECLSSARAIADIVARINATPLPCVIPLQAMLSLSWRSALDVLVRECRATKGTTEGETIQYDLNKLILGMWRGTELFRNLRPVVEMMLKGAGMG